MSDGHGDGGGCGFGTHGDCATPVAGDANVGLVSPAPELNRPVVNGIEINRATIIEKSKQRLAARR